MKVRNGFVSNSSSSSFIINKCDLAGYQIEQLKMMSEIVKNNKDLLDPESYFDDGCWTIVEKENTILGWTYMNNYDLEPFLKFIGVDLNKVTWGD